MHVHRSRHVCGFTALPNTLLQDRRLTYTARGLLADLLSRPDGWREDGRHMADSSPQGRTAVAKALRELTRFGYYRVEKIRQADGTVVSEAHVYDTPQLLPVLPAAQFAGSGGAAAAGADALSKERDKEPSLPAGQGDEQQLGGPAESGEGGRETAPETPPPHTDADADRAPAAASASKEAREAAAVLFRVLRPEPRLRIGAAEALALAPLVAGWLQAGASERDLAAALLPGLPEQVHAPVGLLRDRLERKRPPQTVAPATAAARWHECRTCHDPVPQPGICRACAGLAPRTVAVGGGAAATVRGAARVRAALRGTSPLPAAATA